MATGWPRDAVAVLQSALRGPLDASNRYVTHTELHEMLARAFEAAGEDDSAVAHYRWVVHAWRRAEPEFHRRRAFAQRQLAALEARLGFARSNPWRVKGPKARAYRTITEPPRPIRAARRGSRRPGGSASPHRDPRLRLRASAARSRFRASPPRARA